MGVVPVGSAVAAPVEFTVDVPVCTPRGRRVNLRSNRLDAGTFRHDPLTRVSATRWRGTLDVAVPFADLRYKYSVGVCDDAGCPGIEKAITFTGSGAEVQDRTLSVTATAAHDLVFIWRDALTVFDAMGAATGARPPEEHVSQCAPYLSVGDTGGIVVGYDHYDGGDVAIEWGETTAYGRRLDGAGAHRNFFELDGLRPGAVHHYRMIEDGVPGVDRTFTAPPSPSAGFRFAMFGDTQYYVEDQRQSHLQITRMVERFAPHLVVAVGDLVASERGPGGPGGWMFPEMGRFNIFFGVMHRLMASAPFMTAMGNHEEDAPYFWDAFAYPEPDAPAMDHFDFTYGHVHFTVLYTGSTDGYDVDAILGSTTPWMMRALAAAAADPNIRYKVAVLHRGPMSQGANHPTDGRTFFERTPNGLPAWKDLWRQHGVDLVLAGHNHNFTYARFEDTRYITACSGAPEHNLREPWEATTIHAETGCTANLFDVGEKTIAFTAKRADGTEIEPAKFILCQEANDCEERNSGCAEATRWSCDEGVCEHECVMGTPDAGVDAGLIADAGAADAATMMDAGAVDARAAPDAATAPADAGAHDAAITDSGTDTSRERCDCAAAHGGGRGAWWGIVALAALAFRRRSEAEPGLRVRQSGQGRRGSR